MEQIEMFKKLRDICDSIVRAYESEDEAALEIELGKFIILMIQMDAIK